MPLAAEPTPETRGGTKEGEGAKGAFRQLVGLKGESVQRVLGVIKRNARLRDYQARLHTSTFAPRDQAKDDASEKSMPGNIEVLLLSMYIPTGKF